LERNRQQQTLNERDVVGGCQASQSQRLGQLAAANSGARERAIAAPNRALDSACRRHDRPPHAALSQRWQMLEDPDAAAREVPTPCGG